MKPVFYDEKGIRWKIFLGVLVLLVVFLVTVTFALVNSVIASPNLPPVALTETPGVLNTPAFLEKTGVKNTAYLASLLRLKSLLQTTANASNTNGAPKRFAFYVTWDESSLTSLKLNLPNIDYVVPEWLFLSGSGGNITLIDPENKSILVDYTTRTNSNARIIPLVSNYDQTTGDFNSTNIANLLTSESSRQTLIQNLFNFVTSNKFSGINIDFEEIPTESQTNLTLFMQELYTKFNTNHLIVSQDLPLDNDDFNYANYSKYNDYVMLMAYDYHWSTGPEGPITPQDWYANALTLASKTIPTNKLVISLGNYGYDWNLTSSAPADSLTFSEVMQKARLSSASVEMDQSSLNPHFTYSDFKSNKHSVWYLDAATVYNQVEYAEKIHPAGYALWRLGSEDSDLWKVLNNVNDPKAAQTYLKSISNDYSIDYLGAGEILKATNAPNVGKRNISLDVNTGLITQESLTEYPSSYTIKRWGASNNKTVVLTFDDGPDPVYTPQILKILKQYNVPATFFIIGDQGDLNTGLIKDEYLSGNEIGNHTFTHPNISQISPEQLTLELNATRRLIESITNKSTILFRSPYGEDTEPNDPYEAKPMYTVSNLGYYTVGMNVDPHDWARPPVNDIVNSVVSGVTSDQGNVILLHDGGGDRTNTVAALPQIITQLKAQGYQFVTVASLLNLTRDDVMPAVSNSESFNLALSDIGFVIIGSVFNLIKTIFWIGTLAGLLRLFIVIFLAITNKIKARRVKYSAGYTPSVSVLIPAWNEQKVIVKSVNTLLKSDYPNFDITIIDDGSTDKTYEVALDAFKNNPMVKVLTKKNGGKSSALTYGLNNSDSEIVIGLDADTLYKSDAISKLARHFENERVGAVAGNVKVGNRTNLLTKFQALEYIINQNLDRRAFEILNAISVVPGAIGAWRRKLIIQTGGFYSDTLAEDSELTLRILKLGYKIEYEENAIAYTEAPDNLRVFMKQRFRWSFGILQSTWKHLDVLFKYKYGTLGFFTIPNIIMFHIIFPLIAPILDFFTFLFLALSLWQQFTHTDVSPDGIYKVLIFYALFTLIDIVTAQIAFVLERRESIKLVLLLPFQRIFYKYLMYIISFQSFFTAVKGPLVKWEIKERKGLALK